MSAMSSHRMPQELTQAIFVWIIGKWSGETNTNSVEVPRGTTVADENQECLHCQVVAKSSLSSLCSVAFSLSPTFGCGGSCEQRMSLLAPTSSHFLHRIFVMHKFITFSKRAHGSTFQTLPSGPVTFEVVGIIPRPLKRNRSILIVQATRLLPVSTSLTWGHVIFPNISWELIVLRRQSPSRFDVA